MSTPSFFQRIAGRARQLNSLLCVGLDPHAEELSRLGQEGLDDVQRAKLFCQQVVEATAHTALCFKPNSAFFEALGPEGFQVLEDVCTDIRQRGIPILLDVKRGDIGSTAAAYASAAFEKFKVDAVTVSPYMGGDSLQPFTAKYPDKAAFVLCKTSNPGSNDIQTLKVQSEGDVVPLFVHVANLCGSLNSKNAAGDQLGLVVGATDPVALGEVRKAQPNIWILAPGIGFQGGSLEQTLKAGIRKDGLGLIVPVSRGVSRAENMKTAAEALRDEIRRSVSGLNDK